VLIENIPHINMHRERYADGLLSRLRNMFLRACEGEGDLECEATVRWYLHGHVADEHDAD